MCFFSPRDSLEHPPGSPEVSWPGVAKALKSAGTPRADASTRSISFRFQSCLFLHNVGPTGPTFPCSGSVLGSLSRLQENKQCVCVISRLDDVRVCWMIEMPRFFSKLARRLGV